MKKIDGIIFDMDGVITDTEKWLQRYYLKAAEELGFTKIKAEHILEIRIHHILYVSSFFFL